MLSEMAATAIIIRIVDVFRKDLWIRIFELSRYSNSDTSLHSSRHWIKCYFDNSQIMSHIIWLSFIHSRNGNDSQLVGSIHEISWSVVAVNDRGRSHAPRPGHLASVFYFSLLSILKPYSFKNLKHHDFYFNFIFNPPNGLMSDDLKSDDSSFLFESKKQPYKHSK